MSLAVLQIPEQPGRFAYPDIVPGVDVERRGGTAEALACQRHLVPAWIARRPGDEIVEQCQRPAERAEEHTYELQSLMRTSYAVFCSNKKKHTHTSHAGV